MHNETDRFAAERFYRYDELTRLLRGFQERFPSLAALASIGTSYEGRDIWVMTITNQKSSPADAKPAIYVDGNIHAGEVTGCNVCLYTIDQLLHRYDTDEQITSLLDTTTFYVLPRVQPDGAERYLSTPYTLRSSVRRWPTEEDDHGLYEEDIDGDGLILQMRVADPAGEWRISERDPRLMVKRAPDEMDGTFYRIYVEGMLRDPRPEPVHLAKSAYGIDQNRNWPANWSPHQKGGGPYPLSEPETAAVAKFVEDHPNIVIVQNYHTYGGVILRSPCAESDSQIPNGDVEIYKAMGRVGERDTGYPCVSVYDAFPLTDEQGRRATSGGFIEWTYSHKGILSFATELWDIKSRAGITRAEGDAMRVVADETEEDGLRLLEWNDHELEESGFEPWRSFEHPQLGHVEIGGWRTKEIRQNAPPALLADECDRNFLFTLSQARMLPRLRFKEITTEVVNSNTTIVRATIQNTGFLPSSGSNLGTKTGTKPVIAKLTGADVLVGREHVEIGHVAGYSSAMGGHQRPAQFKADNERMVEFVVRGNGSVTLTIESERAGTISRQVTL